MPYFNLTSMMPMSTVSFLAQLDSRIQCLQKALLWPMISMMLSLELLTPVIFGFFVISYLNTFHLFLFLFVTQCLAVAVQPYVEWILIKKEKIWCYYYFRKLISKKSKKMGTFKWQTRIVVKSSRGTKTSHMLWHGRWNMKY